jgi:hypothetical protein
MGRRAAAGVVALALVVGTAACGDDDGGDPTTPGTESELDGREAGTGGDTTTTQSAGTDGGTTMGATEGNQVPPGG